MTNFPADRRSFTGGVETATAALVEGLQAYTAEFDVHVISAPTTASSDIEECADGMSFHFLGGLHRPWLRPRLPLRVVKTRRLLRRLRPDLVHCQDNPDLALGAILAGYRPVLTVHGIAREEAPLRTGLEFWSAHTAVWLARLTRPWLSAYICNSRYVASRVPHTRPQYAIPNAVGHAFLDAQAAHVGECDSPRLVFIGVIAPLKRPGDLVRAHERLRAQFPDLETDLCGPTEDEAYERELRHRVAQKALTGVRFLGVVDQARLVALLQTATALVLPSAQENAPMAVAEAMAVGIPVIATHVGAIPEMVEDGQTGLLYTAGDIDALVACLGRLLSDTKLRVQLGTNGRAVARERFTPAAVARETVAVYRRLLGEPAHT
ncbi:MAG TPA: glycosyltransferase family 4 protein [Chloroflexota bacterium]